MSARPSLNDAVRNMASGRRVNAEEGEPTEGIDSSIVRRIAAINVKSSNYAKEYRLHIVHQMLMRDIPLDTIAKKLQVSLRTVERDRKLIAEEMKKTARKLDIEEIIGDSLKFYQEVQGMALRTASIEKTPVPLRMLALRTAGAARKDMTSFLEKVGVFEALPYTPSEQNSVDDMSAILGLVQSIAADDVDGYQESLRAGNLNTQSEEEQEYNLEED